MPTSKKTNDAQTAADELVAQDVQAGRAIAYAFMDELKQITGSLMDARWCLSKKGDQEDGDSSR